jgi:hypothetical protein
MTNIGSANFHGGSGVNPSYPQTVEFQDYQPTGAFSGGYWVDSIVDLDVNYSNRSTLKIPATGTYLLVLDVEIEWLANLYLDILVNGTSKERHTLEGNNKTAVNYGYHYFRYQVWTILSFNQNDTVQLKFSSSLKTYYTEFAGDFTSGQDSRFPRHSFNCTRLV